MGVFALPAIVGASASAAAPAASSFFTPGVIGAGLNAAGGVLSGIFGARADNQAAAYNYAAMQENMRRQDEQAFLQRVMANKFYNMATAGQTDARGDQTEYIPGVGWVTTPSAMSDSLIKGSDAEQLARLGTDAQIRRRGLLENEQRRGIEGRTADAQLEQLREQPEFSVQGLKDVLLSRATADTNKAYDRTLDRIGTQAIRSGASNAGAIMQDVNRQRADDVRRAGSGVDAQAMQLYNDLEGARTGRQGNLYNLLASRASNFEDVPFQPSNLNEILASRNASARNTVPNIAGTVINASSNPGGFYPTNIQPQYGTANALGGALSNIGGQFEKYGANQQYNQLIDLFANRQLEDRR